MMLESTASLNTFLSKHLRKLSLNLFLSRNAANVATGSKNYLKLPFYKNVINVFSHCCM